MSVTWSDIDKALDGLVAHQEGILFQRLAVALAKLRWPEVVATETYDDGGEDGLTHPFVSNGSKISLACSTTATYAKVAGDAKKIIDRDFKVDLLVFYCARKIAANEWRDDWAPKLKEQFGCDLLVVSREDIIQNLLRPKNHWLCRQFLALDIPEVPDITTRLRKSLSVARGLVELWQSQLRSSVETLVDLNIAELDENGRPKGRIVDHEMVSNQLAEGSRAILFGAPGAGKTTTLIQTCLDLLGGQFDQTVLPLLVSLPDWIDSGQDILTFAIQHPDFQAEGIMVSDLAILHKRARLVFVLNGWNEIPEELMSTAVRQICRLGREFAAAGIIVATRVHSMHVPLLGASRLSLMDLNESQRRSYVESRLGSDKGRELLAKIEGDPVILQITRTPFMLAEVASLFESDASIPRTRMGVLDCMVKKSEESEEHYGQLNAEPVSARSGIYLTEIATAMTQAGRTTLSEEDANVAILRVEDGLKQRQQIAEVRDPQTILSILCGHHLLQRTSYPKASVHFVHQQFQELYAANKVLGDLVSVTGPGDPEEARRFQADVLNIPAWEEPLTLLAEEIGNALTHPGETQRFPLCPMELGKQLVMLILPLDPIFAANLARLCGPSVWGAVRDTFGTLLRKWYEYPDENHKECALAAMFAIGSEEFGDVIWPLLEDPDLQVFLRSCRVPEQFFISCLGKDWLQRVQRWDEERRRDLMGEFSMNGGRDVIPVLQHFAAEDPSVRVRTEATDGLRWIGARDEFFEAVRSCDDAVLDEMVLHDLLPREIPSELTYRVLKSYQQLLGKLDDVKDRLQLLLRVSRIDETNSISLMKDEFEDYPVDPKSDNHFARRVLEKISCNDPDWASQWVVKSWAEGKLQGEYWVEFVRSVPEGIVDDLLNDFMQPGYPKKKAFRVQGLIIRGANQRHAKSILQRIVELHQLLQGNPPKASDPRRDLYFLLKETLVKVSLPVLAKTLVADYEHSRNQSELRVILDLLGRRRGDGAKEAESRPNKDLLEKLRTVMRGYVEAVLAEEDFGGSLKAEMATALANFGDGEDLPILKQLIQADITRRRKGLEEFQKGNRSSPCAQGASSCWSHWHVRAVCTLVPESADSVLLELLHEEEYEEDAAKGLLHLLTRDIPKEEGGSWRPLPELDFTRRERGVRSFGNKGEREQYTRAIEDRICSLEKQQVEADDANHLVFRMVRLAVVLAEFGVASTVHHVLEVLALPGQYQNWARVNALGVLLRHGFTLEPQAVKAVLNPVINSLLQGGIYNDQQNSNLLRRCLCIITLTDGSSQAVTQVKSLADKYLSVYDLCDLIAAVACGGSAAGLEWLLELAQNPKLPERVAHDLLKVLGRLPEARETLLSAVDPRIKPAKIRLPARVVKEALPELVANICEEDRNARSQVLELCQLDLPDSHRSILAGIVNLLSTTEALRHGLNLVSDDRQPRIPFPLQQGIEKVLVRHTPIGEYTYRVKPQEAAELQKHLMDLVLQDDKRRLTAFDLLGFCQRLRLKHGRPLMESRHPHFESGYPWPLLDLVNQPGN